MRKIVTQNVLLVKFRGMVLPALVKTKMSASNLELVIMVVVSIQQAATTASVTVDLYLHKTRNYA